METHSDKQCDGKEKCNVCELMMQCIFLGMMGDFQNIDLAGLFHIFEAGTMKSQHNLHPTA